jgi:hypothetical protein
MAFSRFQRRLAWVAGVLLLASAGLNVVLAARQVLAYRDVATMGATLAADPEAVALIQAAPRVQGQARALVSDLVAYSETHPAMADLLARHGVQAGPAPRQATTSHSPGTPSIPSR